MQMGGQFDGTHNNNKTMKNKITDIKPANLKADPYWGTEEFRVWFEGLIEKRVESVIEDFVQDRSSVRNAVEDAIEDMLERLRAVETKMASRVALAVERPMREAMYRLMLEATERHAVVGGQRPIGVLDLGEEIVNLLVVQGFFSVDQLSRRAADVRDLLSIPGIGNKEARLIVRALKKAGALEGRK